MTQELEARAASGTKAFLEERIPVSNKTKIVIDFRDPDEADRWLPVGDTVMGGRSASRMESTPDGTTVFVGEVSLEDDGGFASARTAGERCSLAGATAVTLRVRGDGQRYQLRCRVDSTFDGVSYQSTFETRAGEWVDVTLELATFEPKWRGRRVQGAPALEPADVRGLGLMIADEQEGPFRLELMQLSMS